MGVSYEVQGKFKLKGEEKIQKLSQYNTERTAVGGFADQYVIFSKNRTYVVVDGFLMNVVISHMSLVYRYVTRKSFHSHFFLTFFF